ncbi:hypothetical protein [Mariniphaga sediminis]|uniref:hypothetical protein n=1 Tax=Mariniphaga sediminis TaxID=1628158 RepID=UPI00356B2B97
MSSKLNFTKQSNFHDVFGDSINAYTEEERRQRWDAYKKVIGPRQSKMWHDLEACAGCIHIDEKEAWCKDMGLPCTINPHFGFSMLGMACMGLGREEREPELNLFQQPF